VSKDTIKPKTGDWVSLNMSYKYKDSLLFDNKQAMAAPIRFKLPVSDFKGDIYEGIRMMSKGDSAEFLINADSLFTKTFQQKRRPPFIDTNSVISFRVTLLSTDSPETLMKTEDDALKNYLETQKITVPPTESGLYFIEKQAGKGMAIDSGKWVKVQFKVSLIDGKQIFSSYDRGEPIAFEYGKRFDTKGFEEGVGKMKKGGKASLIVPSTLAFGEMGRGTVVPPYATILYEVEVVDVITKADYEKQQNEAKKKEEQKKENAKKDETTLLKKYLKEKNITAQPTASGIYYIEKAKGTGARAAAGKKVKVHYTGTLLNGTKFDSSRDRNEPFEFELGKGQVIKGWDEGIALMNVGGKAILIIPSNMAYGDREIPTIPAYSTLVFDVDLVDVK
jgi:FKBP-type peptidyl-prolyl cis-trans isomerase